MSWIYTCKQVKGKGKGRVLPRTGHKGPKGGKQAGYKTQN
jgi:hypothetical protein